MMQPELLQLSWPYCNTRDSSLDEVEFYYGMDTNDPHMGSFELSSSFISRDESSIEVSSSFPCFSTMDVPILFPMEQECLVDAVKFTAIDDFDEWMVKEREEVLWSPPSDLSMVTSEETSSMNDLPSAQPCLILPEEDMEIDTQLSLLHLLKAYGEAAAMEKEHEELAEEILRRLREKASPIGSAIERLTYYLSQDSNEQGNYLTQESIKNYKMAFKAFYQIFPFGRFAHFTANSVILEAMPEDVETVNIVDFDIGEGLQWPSLIEALGRQRRHRLLVRLISIKWDKEDGSSSCSTSSSTPSPWRFDETKIRLLEHAQLFCLDLEVEEIEMEALASEMKKKKTKKSGGGNEWTAFNCMVGLPHMAKRRSFRHVTEFLKLAKNTINKPIKNCQGVINFADGNGGFGLPFEGHLAHFLALIESMEIHFPNHLTAARKAMEYLFIAPHVSSLADHSQKLEGSVSLKEMEFDGWRMSRDNFVEAKELVREGESLYWVRIEGENENQMVLGYMETPLVRVSSWSQGKTYNYLMLYSLFL